MRVLEDAWRRDDLPRGAVVTIGNFDGVHRGQRALLERTQAEARRLGTSAALVTFEPHPLAVLQPGRAPMRLTSRAQKLELLAAAGVEVVCEIAFDQELARTSAETFVEEFLGGRMAVRRVLVGSHFSFGRGREGNLALLIERGAALGFGAEGVPELLHDGQPISSTRIRELVAGGQVAEARELLGRPFAVGGTVAAGEGRGRGLGWPTANLATDNELLPGNGVYVTRARLEGDAEGRMSVTNVGTRPTFDAGETRQIEAHLLDWEGDLYGRRLTLAFCRRLRGERRFASPEELSRQIAADVSEAREYFATCVC